MAKIAVYAGHGGSNPGAVANGLLEKDLNLAISNRVTELLRQKGYEVVNNRTMDVDRNIVADANLANNENVDALVEIHFNSNQGTPQSGTETFYSAFNAGTGRELAQAIQDEIVSLGYVDRGIKVSLNQEGQDALGIIRLTNAPAVLVEVAFINNPEEMERLNVDAVANAIASGIEEVIPNT